MNADHEFAVLDWKYASIQDIAGHSEFKSIDGDFPIFEIDQNEPTDVGPSTSRALNLQELVIYFDQSAEDPAKYNKIAKFFSLDANPCSKSVKECKICCKNYQSTQNIICGIKVPFYIPRHICKRIFCLSF